MQLVDQQISLKTLTEMSQKMYGNLVKAVVDIEKEIMVVDAGMHADEEEFMLENGSLQRNLWGFNLYPGHVHDASWIEFDSMINIRPAQGNRSRNIENVEIQNKIRSIVAKLVQK